MTVTEMKPIAVVQSRVRLRVEDYLLLDRSGAFADYAKTELIEGEVLYVNAQHRPHARVKTRLYRLLADALDALEIGLEALVEASVEITPENAPEPDIVLTYLPNGEGLVPLGSVALIVEVSDATLDIDLGRKATLYATHGIPEYWVIDVAGRVIHRMSTPSGGGYGERAAVAFGEMIASVTVAGLNVETGAL